MNWESHFRGLNKSSNQFGGAFNERAAFGSDNSENLRAVNEFFHDAVPKTKAAEKLQSEWVEWWETEGNPELFFFSVPDAIWNEARNRRNAFEAANAVTTAEKKQATTVAKTGMTSEQTGPKPTTDRRDPTTGNYYQPEAPLVPAWAKPMLLAGGAFAVGMFLLPKVAAKYSFLKFLR